MEFPINKSSYGFKPSTVYGLNIMALSGPIGAVKTNGFRLTSIGINASVLHSTYSEWDGLGKTPNSKSTIYIPGLSFLFASKAGTFGINIQKGYEDYLQNSPEDIKETNDIYAISLSYRRVLDKIIEKLYWWF